MAKELFDGLSADHGLLNRVLDAFERHLGALRAAPDGHVESLRFLHFFREFGERYHQKKEEQVLFPALNVHGYADHRGPLAHVREQHARERELLQTLFELAFERAPNVSAERIFEVTGNAFVQFLREHQRKEGELLLPAAARELFFDPKGPVRAQLALIDEQELAGGRRHFLEQLAEQLVAAHPASA